jgi:trehalose 6-phosphate phosphatase
MMVDETLPNEAVSMDVVDASLDVLAQTPSALLTDIDGTISAIAPTPFEAVVDPAARAALARLAARLDAVVAVSGRAPGAGAEMVGLPELIYVGNHGLERIVRGTPWTHPAAEEARAAIAAALAEIEAEVREQDAAPWLLVENKGVTGTVHYRLAPDHAAAAAMLEPLAVVAAERNGLRVSPGRMIVELRPALAVNKGTAIVDLARDLGLRGLVFFGDDLTDVDGFRALRELREAGNAATLSVGVLGAETAEAVTREADMTVPGVPACATTLLAIADRLEASDHQAADTEERVGAILGAQTEPGPVSSGVEQGEEA